MNLPAIDPATLMLTTAVTGLLSAAFSFMAAKAFAGIGDSARDWGYGMLTFGGAALLWFLSELLPRWAGFVLGNALVVLTPLLLVRAVFRFEGARPPQLSNALMLGLGLGGILVVQWADAPKTFAVAGIATAHVLCSVLVCWRLYWQGRRTGSVYCLVLFVVMATVGLATLARLLVLLFGEGAAAVAPIAGSKTQTAAIGVATLLMVAGSFGFLGMVAERSKALILEHAVPRALP